MWQFFIIKGVKWDLILGCKCYQIIGLATFCNGLDRVVRSMLHVGINQGVEFQTSK